MNHPKKFTGFCLFMLVFYVVQAQEAIVQNGQLDLQIQNLILQESAEAVDRIYAAEPEEVRSTASEVQDIAASQPQPTPHVPFRLREAGHELWKAELKAMHDAYEEHVKERYDRFTATRNRKLPMKGRRMDYTGYNSQFQPIERR
ncbi:MAG: hypothetical protein CMN54_12635 [SAR324 cluster bacterium]|uniref:Uncharacterized protein n=1 Tax=SAR324 cluster bacterium TaxID=2024889 RepID=A0A2D6YM86_9DELT|nr:hypothetical protein [SAR324 cluster bacterium]